MSNEQRVFKGFTHRSLLITYKVRISIMNSTLATDMFALLGKQGVYSDAKSIGIFSKDAYYYSPILRAKLESKRADVIVAPQNTDELRKVIEYACKHSIAITPRGAGTGNYGQAVPLERGIVLSMHRMNKILDLNQETGLAKVQAGTRMGQLERLAREQGWELRCYPSTWATATIGGFVGGGFGGVGSIRWGVLWDNYLNSISVTEMTPEANTYTLRGADMFGFIHAYGMSGIMTELGVNLAPKVNWEEAVMSFPSLEQALYFAYDLANDDSIAKRLICINEWPIPTFFKPLVNAGAIKEARANTLLELGQGLTDVVAEKAKSFGGTLDYRVESSTYHKNSFNLSDFSWNHTTLWAMKTDETWTYIQSRFDAEPDKALAQVATLREHDGDKVLFHFEYLKQNGELVLAALDLLRSQDAKIIQAAMNKREEIGIHVADPHTYYLDADPRWGGESVLAAKAKYNPKDLLNPGKLSGHSIARARSW
jgi:FAD/FMN-containing dehydrogenase